MHTGLDPAEGVVLFLSAESVFEGFPGLHAAAGQFEGAAAVPAQQDALFAEQHCSDADGRVCVWRSGAAGSAGEWPSIFHAYLNTAPGSMPLTAPERDRPGW